MTSATATLPATVGPDPADLLWVGARPTGRRGRVVVDVVGEVDDYTAPLLAACLHGQSARSAVRTLVLDLSRVRSLSRAGHAVIEEAAERCAARGARLVLRPGQRPPRVPTRAAPPRRGRSRGPRNVARPSPPGG